MIIGLGSDLIDIRRVEQTLERYGARFVDRIFTEVEQKKYDRRACVHSCPAIWQERMEVVGFRVTPSDEHEESKYDQLQQHRHERSHLLHQCLWI